MMKPLKPLVVTCPHTGVDDNIDRIEKEGVWWCDECEPTLRRLSEVLSSVAAQALALKQKLAEKRT